MAWTGSSMTPSEVHGGARCREGEPSQSPLPVLPLPLFRFPLSSNDPPDGQSYWHPHSPAVTERQGRWLFGSLDSCRECAETSMSGKNARHADGNTE